MCLLKREQMLNRREDVCLWDTVEEGMYGGYRARIYYVKLLCLTLVKSVDLPVGSTRQSTD